MDTLVAGVLFILIAVYLVQRQLGSMIVWVVLAYLVGKHGMAMNHTFSVVLGLMVIYLICMVTKENFENEEDDPKPKKGKTPDPAPPKTDDPHVDIGTTILHAYRNLSPEQIGGMRRDTKELLSLQKELMGSLAEMKPAIEQGAELLSTFSTFFGEAPPTQG
jgi:hypothetical protein